MDKTLYSLILVAVMAIVTYIIRVTPFVFFRKKIKSRFIKSFLYYVPYAVLIAMTFPTVFSVTGNAITSIVGTVVAIVSALNKKTMMVVVALLAVIAVLLSEGILYII
ncbi:MAG: AzlD domain-containing protein [Clostridia bacterium]|nr:AzlD domain-containing protein [Clostridia bacterium]